MKYVVYLTTNNAILVDGKNPIYIGVHLIEDPEIWDNYLGCGVYSNQPSTYNNPKTPFQYAVKQYKVESFSLLILYIFDTAEEAYNKEKEIVNRDFIKQSHVYNACIGGKDNWYLGRPIYLFDLNGKLIKKWEYGIYAYEYFNISRTKFNYAIYDKHPLIGYLWGIENTINPELYTSNERFKFKPTYLFNENGELIQEFDSLYDCLDFLGETNIKKLNSALYKGSLFKKKYYISYDKSFKKNTESRYKYINRKFYVYKNNEYVGECVGKELLNIIKNYSWNTLICRFKTNNFWVDNFYISFEKINNIPIHIKKNEVAVDIYDINGNFIETLPKIRDVKQKYKLNSHNIKNVKLHNISHNGYIFKYHQYIE